MTYPSCYRYWIEQEITPELWTSLDIKSGWSTVDEAHQRIATERARGESFASRRYRIVDRERRLVEAVAS